MAVAETKTAIPAVETLVIDLIVVGGDTKLHGVRAPDPGEIVGQLVIAVIVSAGRLRRDPEREVGQAGGRNPSHSGFCTTTPDVLVPVTKPRELRVTPWPAPVLNDTLT